MPTSNSGSSRDRDSDSSGRRADWRKRGEASAKSSGGSQSRDRWTHQKRDVGAESKARHRVVIGALLALLVVAIGSLVYYLIFNPTRVPLLVLSVTSGHPLVPPNAWAREDAQRLRTTNPTNVSCASPLDLELTREEFLGELNRQLAAAEPGGPRRQHNVVVYLSAHGVVDERNEPCLLVRDSAPHDSKTWLPLREVLQHVIDQPALKRVAAKRLVILDCNRVQSEWRLGILYNGFADRVAELVRELNSSAERPDLFVLNSTRGSQIGWAGPELRGSAFGYFVARGVSGAADEDGDHTLTIQELYQYVRENVREWVRLRRGDVQEPILIPDDADVRLVNTAGSVRIPEPSGEDELTPAMAAAVADLWRGRDTALRGDALRAHPALAAEVEQKLLRLEQLMVSGEAYESEAQILQGDLKDLLSALGKMPALPVAPASLTLARRWRDPAVPETPGGDPFLQWRQASAKPVAPGQPLPAIPAHPAAVDAAWSWLRSQVDAKARLTWDDVQTSVQFVAAAPSPREPELVEAQWLRLVAGYVDRTRVDSTLLGPSLLARAAADDAATPFDERVQYWDQRRVDAADDLRRLAEDQLYVGNPAALALATQTWAGLMDEKSPNSYAPVIALHERVARVFALRDEAYARVPYLAEWLVIALRPGAGQAAKLAQRATLADLRALIADTHQLGVDLDQSLARQEWTTTLESRAGEVEVRLRKLSDVYAEHCDELEKSGDDQKAWRQLHDALRVPLLPANKRATLLTKSARILKPRSGGATSGGVTSGSETEQAAVAVDDTEYWTGLAKQHPALDLVSTTTLEPPTDDKGAPSVEAAAPNATPGRGPTEKLLAERGGELRAALDRVAPRARKWVAEAEQLLMDPQSTIFEARGGLSRADRLSRAAAVLLAHRTSGKAEEEPTARLRSFDRYQLLTWHAWRALRDFWGDPPGGDSSPREATVAGGADPRVSSEPYFGRVAEAYLRGASALAPQVATARRGAIDLRAMLAECRTVARTGPQMRAAELRIGEEDPMVSHHIDVQTPAPLPDGTLTVFVAPLADWPHPIALRDDESQDITRRGVTVGATAQAAPLKHVVRKDAIGDHLTLDSVALFRGHLWRQPVAVGRIGRGDEVVVFRQPLPPPRAEVRGETKENVWVAFILDCSGSMNAVVKGDLRRRNRLQVARGVLLDLLTDLANLPNQRYRVGVTAYGHRTHWENRKIVPTEEYAPKVKATGFIVHPSEDVEPLIEITEGRLLTTELRDKIETALGPLHPWGETPLYYSIREALNGLGRADIPATAPRHIVVITDGLNTSYDDDPKSAKVKLADLADSLKTLQGRGRPVQLDVIGFDLSAKDITDRKDEVDRFGQLATSTQGKFHSAREISELVKALEESLNLGRFYVREVGAKEPPPEQQKRLGDIWTVSPWADRESPYEVGIHGVDQSVVPVTLAGGESLEMLFNRTTRRLEFVPFVRDYFRDPRTKIPDPASAEDQYQARAHLPRREGEGIEFAVSLQNMNPNRFTPRPALVWAEITPLYDRAPTRTPKFVFYDADFELYQPVPVMKFRVPRWPVEAEEADIRVWVKMKDDTEPRVERFAPNTPPGKNVQVEGDQLEIATQLRSDRNPFFRVTVVERYPKDVALPTWRLDLRPAADYVSRRFNPEDQTVRHEFRFERSVETGDSLLLLRLTPKDRILRNAIDLCRQPDGMSKPLRVKIPRS